MAICHRSELRVYDRTGTGSYTVLPASGLGFSTSLGGGGFLSVTAESRAEPLATTPALLDDCVIKLALPLSEPGTSLTEVLAFANRARNGTLWEGAGQQVRRIQQAPSLFTAWSQDAILHPEGNAITQMTADKRYFGWQSTIYDPTGDGWGTPSDATGQQDSTTGNRAGQPDGWPTELGNAYWITRGATSNGTRHLFIKDVVVPSDCYLTVYWSSDETAVVYFGGATGEGLNASASETGFLTTNTWSAWVTSGRYRVGIDKTSVVTRPGGNGRDPVLLAVATNDSDGAVQDILLVTDSSWLVYTLDPVSGEAPSLTPGAIVVELAAQAAARGVDTWSALTLGFDADVDSDGLPWPVREERDWRIAYDRHLDMIEGLGDLGFCPEITPGLVLEAWSKRGTDRSATVTIAALVEADSVDESGTGVAATYMPTETEDGWVIVENATAAATYGRRETALSLGNAPSIAQGRRLGQKVLDDRLSRPETEWTVQFYATARCTPFVDFNLGDTVTIDINGTGTPRVVLDIGGQAEHTEGIIRWTIKTGDTAMPARFNTQPGNALADGGVSEFFETYPVTFETLGGSATADGGVSFMFDGAGDITGGTTYDSGGYRYHCFTSSGSLVANRPQIVDILLVAGGGGSHTYGGGGGAGGVVYLPAELISEATHTVTVGAGGSGTSNGANSVFGALTQAVGGGAGGAYEAAGSSGGSGGGGGQNATATSYAGGAGTSGQGNSGGATPGVDQSPAGGGGGAGSAGGDGSGPPVLGGNGGAGTSAYSSWGSIVGQGHNVSGTYYFAGGGGGPVYAAGSPGAGGNGGGGAGVDTAVATSGNPGQANTGGGAGGGYANTSGGSGIVIVRYLL